MLDSTQPTSLAWGETLFFFYNDAYVPILAEKHPRAVALPFWEVWADVKEAGLLMDEVLGGQSVFQNNVPFRMLRKGEMEEAWFTYSLLPLRDEQGGVKGFFNVCMETTNQVEVERRSDFLLKLADRLRPLTEPDAITAAASELLGSCLNVARVLYAEVNEATGKFVIRQGWTRDGLSSVAGEVRALDDFGPEAISILRSGRPLIIDDITQDPRTASHLDAYQKIGVGATLSIPFVRSGQLNVVLSLHQAEPFQWTKSDIQLTYDVAERTWAAAESARVNKELRFERDRSQSVFDTMTEGFGMLDRDWTLVYMNAEGLRIGGRSEQQAIGKNHWDTWPEYCGSEVESMYRRVMQTRQPELLEALAPSIDGIAVWLEIRVYPGAHDGISIFFRDVTSRKEAEGKLRDADRRKDEFLAMLAHELRNPLAPIGAAAQLLQMGRLNEERVQRTSEVIGRQVNHMTGLIDDLLDVSRVTRGLIELNKVALDIYHVVNEAVEQVNPLIRKRGHELVIRHAPQAGRICGDKKRLVQVLANVLNNAAKYTAEGGHLVLSTLVRESDVLIEVTDDGIGMTADMTRHAFELFAQAERTSDRSSGGLGLGLALVKSLVDLHDGTVHCKSDGLGQGSTFSICLPLLRQDAGSGSGRFEETAPLETAVASLRILVVDDNVDAAAMLKMLLETMGHEVRVEHRADRALERAKLDRPQVCLLDIGLPEMDGNELARELRAQPENRGVMLVAVTGYGQESDRINALSSGFDHHLVKPVNTTKLLSILSAIKVS